MLGHSDTTKLVRRQARARGRGSNTCAYSHGRRPSGHTMSALATVQTYVSELHPTPCPCSRNLIAFGPLTPSCITFRTVLCLQQLHTFPSNFTKTLQNHVPSRLGMRFSLKVSPSKYRLQHHWMLRFIKESHFRIQLANQIPKYQKTFCKKLC